MARPITFIQRGGMGDHDAVDRLRSKATAQKQDYVPPKVTDLGDVVARTLGAAEGTATEAYGYSSWAGTNLPGSSGFPGLPSPSDLPGSAE